MLFSIARLLQLVGLVILPVAISGNMANPDQIDLRTSLMLSAGGVVIFVSGWLLQQAVRPRGE